MRPTFAPRQLGACIPSSSSPNIVGRLQSPDSRTLLAFRSDNSLHHAQKTEKLSIASAVIVGGAGAGKTTLLHALQRALGMPVACAPSHFRRFVLENVVRGVTAVFEHATAAGTLHAFEPHVSFLNTMITNPKHRVIAESSFDLHTIKEWKLFFSHLSALVADPAFCAALDSPTFHTPYQLSYFLPRLSRLTQPNYSPTPTDIDSLYFPVTHNVFHSTRVSNTRLHLHLLPSSSLSPSPLSSFTRTILGPYLFLLVIPLDDYHLPPHLSTFHSSLSFLHSFLDSPSFLNASSFMVVLSKLDHLPALSSRFPFSSFFPPFSDPVLFLHTTFPSLTFHPLPLLDPQLTSSFISDIHRTLLSIATPKPPLPSLPKHPPRLAFSYSFKEKKKLSWVSGVASEIGHRKANEDSVVALNNANRLLPLQSKQRCAYYAIFDGHNGDQAAVLAADLLHGEVFDDPDFIKAHYTDCLKNAYRRLDRRLCGDLLPDDSGTTAVTAAIHGRALVVANVGDSECCVVKRRNGAQYEVLTYKHTARDEREKERVKACGGYVFNNRLYGSLAVTRSLGDRSYKGKGVVESEPFVSVYELTSSDACVVLACDGVYERMTHDDVAAYVSDQQARRQTPEETARGLVRLALEKGSQDNVSAIVVFLRWD